MILFLSSIGWGYLCFQLLKCLILILFVGEKPLDVWKKINE